MAKENEYRAQGGRYGFIISVIFHAALLIYVYWVFTHDNDLSSIRIVQIWVFILVFAPIFLALSFITSLIRYTFREDSLIVKSAFKVYEIKYSTIRQVEEINRPFAQFRSPATAPGNSQIRIVYDGNNEIFISPEKIEKFVIKLKSRLPVSVIYNNSGGRQ